MPHSDLLSTLHQMAAEGSGMRGNGVLAFEFVGSPRGTNIFTRAARGDVTATIVVDALEHFCLSDEPPGTVPCLLCQQSGQAPSLILAVYPYVPRPSCVACSSICRSCSRAMPDFDTLQREIVAAYRWAFPGLEILPPLSEPGHA